MTIHLVAPTLQEKTAWISDISQVGGIFLNLICLFAFLISLAVDEVRMSAMIISLPSCVNCSPLSSLHQVMKVEDPLTTTSFACI